jgi:hypothetical protein
LIDKAFSQLPFIPSGLGRLYDKNPGGVKNHRKDFKPQSKPNLGDMFLNPNPEGVL